MADHKDGVEDHRRVKRSLKALGGQFCGEREKVKPREIRVKYVVSDMYHWCLHMKGSKHGNERLLYTGVLIF